MQYSSTEKHDAELIVQLYKNTFTDSAGTAEGKAIAELVEQLLAEDSVTGFVAAQGKALQGAIIFSALAFTDGTRGLLLSPVAVRTESQNQGIGRQLINHGLSQLKLRGHDIVFTYGDPTYYSRFGFVVVSEDRVAAPYPLSMPEGWQGLSLQGADVMQFEGSVQCAAPFMDAKLW